MNSENSRFAKAYIGVVKSYLDELSEKMNSKGREYEQNLESLKQLIQTGKTEKRLVEQLNNHLVAELKRVSEYESKMVIDVEKAKPDEFNQLVGQLQNMIKKAIENGVGTFDSDRLAFKAEFKNKFEYGINEIFLTNRIIKAFCEEAGGDPTILEQYIDNYMRLTNSQSIHFTEESIIKYFHFVEYKIFKSLNDDESTLQARVRESVKEYTNIISNDIDSTDDIELFEKEVISSIKNHFGWLEEVEADPKIQEAMNDFKARVREKIFYLASEANSKVFPRMLEQKVDDSRRLFGHIIQEINDTISALEDKRKILLDELDSAGLLEYQKRNSVAEATIVDYSTALDERRRLSSELPAVLFKRFISARNEKSGEIKKQLNKEIEDSYFGINKRIEALQGIPKEDTDMVIIYFVRSIQAFMNDLELTILSDLSRDYLTASNDVREIETKYKSLLGRLRQQEKEEERRRAQDNINRLLGSMTQYQLPTSLADKIMSNFPFNSESEIENFIEVYTEEKFTERVKDVLSEMSLEDIFSNSHDRLDTWQEINGQLTKMRVAQYKPFGSIIKDSAKTLADTEKGKELVALGLSMVPGGTAINVGFKLAYGIYKGIKDKKKKDQQAVDEMRETMKQLVHQLGTVVIREKFSSELTRQSDSLNQATASA